MREFESPRRGVATALAMATSVVAVYPQRRALRSSRGVLRWAALIAVPLALFLSACAGAPQKYSSEQHQTISLAPGDLERDGMALITPSTVTGQEEERQAVALTFAEVLRTERPSVRVVTLAETVGAINKAGLADEYRTMYQDYRDTGVFRRETLARVGDSTRTRYIAQLKLSGFAQESSNRFSAFGLRIMETKRATVRLYLQIWDARSGTVAWEGLQETTYSEEAVTEQRVTLRVVLTEASTALVKRLT